MMSLRSYTFALLLLSAPACMDVERVIVSTTASAANFDRAACVKCMSPDSDPATSCATVAQACNKVPECAGTLACTLKSCVGKSFADFITCVNACVKDNGLVGGVGSDVAIPTYQCLAIAPCRSKCIIDSSDGGTPEDAGAIPDASVDTPDADAGISDVGSPACSVPEGTPNNEKGIGASCKSGADCDQSKGLRLCTADYGIEPKFCTAICSGDADCGTGMYCAHSAQGDGCTPLACKTGPE
jgi:hypothetical protein